MPSPSRFIWLVNGALALAAAWLLALITWQLLLPAETLPLPAVRPVAEPVVVPLAGRSAWFGAPARQTPAAQDMTNLPLTLTGLLASSDERAALAVILYQGKQASYAPGDALPIAGVSVQGINTEGVVLAEPGGLRLLSYPKQARSAAPVERKLAASVAQHPQQIFDYLSVSPVRDDNSALLGYRINPGRQPALFGSLGFKPNDLAVAINGADLRDTQQAQQILLQLPQLTGATVTVEREGQRHDILVSLDEGTP
ncbi:type II secretion system protein GspC [Serratia sp. L9]|uniref:type II secretion system protein GspC n=1 Tax=Serratia sp. L9 TaxID=3423946 RepID=UPI003D67A836